MRVQRLKTLVLSMLFSTSASASYDYRFGEYIVRLRTGVQQANEGLKKKFKSDDIQVLNEEGDFLLVKRSKVEIPEAVVQDLGRNAEVMYAERNMVYYTQDLPNDPRLEDLWGLVNDGQKGGLAGLDLGMKEAWKITKGSEQVIVAVIDTGVDYNNTNLATNMWTNRAELNGVAGVDDDNNGFVDDVYGYDFKNNDADPMDDHGHGTHVSGTIGAAGNNSLGVVGVNWTVKIMALKFLSEDGGTTDGAIRSIDYATRMGATLSNNSWSGGGFSQALYDTIARARAAGQLFVAAAGNNSRNTDRRLGQLF
jgi:thermitase